MNVTNVYTAGDKLVEKDCIWCSCNELPPNYQFSDTGLVRKFITSQDFQFVEPAGKNLTITINGKQHLVHRIIASLFVDNPSNLPLVKHLDGDIRNICADNLMWVNPSNPKKQLLSSSHNWVRCVETGELYHSINCVDYVLGIPREVVSISIKDKVPVCGLHFEFYIPEEDERIDDAIVVTHSQMKAAAFESSSYEEYKEKIQTIKEAADYQVD